jgi:hypothetical protein
MLLTIIGDLFELFGDERGTIGKPHVARREFAKERASSGVEVREPVEIEYEVMTGATVGCECFVAHATQFFHPLADCVAFNLERVAVARIGKGEGRDLQHGSALCEATAVPEPAGSRAY